MKSLFKNITILSLAINALLFISCNNVSKSCCEEVLNSSYNDNDSVIEKHIVLAQKCSEKYHKRPDFLQKISQIYYYDAVNDYSSEDIIQSSRKLFLALDNINTYFSRIDEIKSFDYQFRGEIYERLGDIYNGINSLKQAAELYDKALSDYESSGNNEKAVNILIKSGKLYQYNHIPNIAMIYFEMAEEKQDISQNIHRKIIDNKIVTLYELNDYKNADSIFTNHFNIKIQDYDFHSAIGTKYFYERNYMDALPHLEYCFDNGNQQEKLVFSEKLAEVYFNLNDHENEMLYIQYQAKHNALEIRKTPLKLDLEKIFDTYYKEDYVENNKNNFSKLFFYIILILICSISFIILYFITKSKKDKEKIRSAQETINGNQDIIQSKDKIINDISKKLVDLEPNINFDEAYHNFTNSNIYNKIKSSFEGITILTKNVQDYSKLKLSNKDLISLVKTFHNYFPKAISSLKEKYDGITSNDVRFIILTFINMNNAEIAVLLGLTYGAANKRSNKIKNIINSEEDLHTFFHNFIKSNY